MVAAYQKSSQRETVKESCVSFSGIPRPNNRDVLKWLIIQPAFLSSPPGGARFAADAVA